MKLKTNEQTTQEFETEEIDKLNLLKANILNCTNELRGLQKEHKSITGKNYVVF